MESSHDIAADQTALLHTYEEICKSYHAIDDFRTKLLGLLPLSSLLGIFLLGEENLISDINRSSPELIAFISLFAATFTLALFIYEIRGTLRCNNLIKRGEEIEALLKVKGQFYVCREEHCNKQTSTNRIANIFNAKLAACLMYSSVFAAWIFMGLRLGFEIHVYGCVITALVAGLTLGIITYQIVKRLIAT
ncbi:hypothetical protein [Sphaerothrix gracilis]|uniref:hypothetical protein n=1 Tax=Sphaerothrix gracilis TaxID=3151835 RepID=UPI0031FDEA9D